MEVLGHLLDTALTPLRPYLQPITTSLPSPIQTFLSNLLTPACYHQLIEQLLPLHPTTSSPQCLHLAISKTLGVTIITASSIVKIPQLLKLLNSRSSEGVSFLSYLLETTAFLITLAYNFRSGFPFSTFGETAMIAVQNIFISILILNYNPRTKGLGIPAAFVAGLATLGYALFTPSVVSMENLRLIQAFVTIPLSLAAKVPQIIQVARERSTGQLSAFAVFNYVAGSLARVFTTLAEVDDKLILLGFVAGLVLNVVLAGQMVWFWNAPAAGKKVEKRGEERKSAGSSTGVEGKRATRRKA